MKNSPTPDEVRKWIEDTICQSFENMGMKASIPTEEDSYENQLIEATKGIVQLMTDTGHIIVSVPERKIWLRSEDVGYSILAAIPYSVEGMQYKDFDLFIGKNHIGTVKYGGPKPIEASDRGVCLGYETSISLVPQIKSFTMTVEIEDGE